VQLVLYAERQLGFGGGGYGLLLAALGLGGLLSATFNGRLAASTKVSAIAVVTGSVFCATQLVYAATDTLAVALAATLVGGAGFVACEVVAETALARVVASDSLGRVMGVVDAVSVAAMISGALLAPLIISLTSLTTSFVVLGAVTLIATGLSEPACAGRELSRARSGSSVAHCHHPKASGRSRRTARRAGTTRFGIAALLLPPGVDIVVRSAGACLLRRHRRTRGRASRW
jgi:hypothetical protein